MHSPAVLACENPHDLPMNRVLQVWKLWHAMRRKSRRLLWQADYRFRVYDVTFLIHVLRGWDEVYYMVQGDRAIRFVRLLRNGEVNWAERTNAMEYLMGVFDKIPPIGSGAPDNRLPEDSKFLDKWPGIFELMTAREYPSGGARERSTLFILIEEGVFKVQISERTRDLTCWGTGPSLDGALSALETRLTSDSAEWRVRPKKKGGK